MNNIAVVYQALGQYQQALAADQQAMDVLELVRATAGSEQGRAGFIARFAGLYDGAVALYHRQGQDDLAFVTSERGRARAFLDSLATGTIQLSDQGANALLAREQQTYITRQADQDKLARALAASPPDPTLVATLQRQLASATETHDAALAAIERYGRQLAALVPSRTKDVLGRPAIQRLLGRAPGWSRHRSVARRSRRRRRWAARRGASVE